MTLDRAHSADWLHEHQMLSLTHTVSDMIKAIGGVQKVNSMVLPLPYAQLLKWGLIIFVFSLPFFIIVRRCPPPRTAPSAVATRLRRARRPSLASSPCRSAC